MEVQAGLLSMPGLFNPRLLLHIFHFLHKRVSWYEDPLLLVLNGHITIHLFKSDE